MCPMIGFIIWHLVGWGVGWFWENKGLGVLCFEIWFLRYSPDSMIRGYNPVKSGKGYCISKCGLRDCVLLSNFLSFDKNLRFVHFVSKFAIKRKVWFILHALKLCIREERCLDSPKCMLRNYFTFKCEARFRELISRAALEDIFNMD